MICEGLWDAVNKVVSKKAGPPPNDASQQTTLRDVLGAGDVAEIESIIRAVLNERQSRLQQFVVEKDATAALLEL
jgi:hypothetical protein